MTLRFSPNNAGVLSLITPASELAANASATAAAASAAAALASQGAAAASLAALSAATAPDALLNLPTGFHFDNDGANIWRVQDRMFVSEAAENYEGNNGGTDGGTSIFGDVTQFASYLPYYAKLLVTAESVAPDLGPAQDGGVRYALVACQHGSGIAGSFASVSATPSHWAMYVETRALPGNSLSLGAEFSPQNRTGTNYVPFPSALGGGSYCLWLAANGGSPNGEPGPSLPSAAAIALLLNTDGGNTSTFNVGMIVTANAITAGGPAIALSSVAAHPINWYDASNNVRGQIKCDATTAKASVSLENGGVRLEHKTVTASLHDAASASSVNFAHITAQDTGTGPVILARSFTDTNVDLNLRTQNAGLVSFGTYTGTPGAITGYITIKDAAGNSRKIAVTA